MSSTKRPADIPGEVPQPYKKRQYGHSCLACRERKVKCEGGEDPPCRQCRDTNTVCEAVERSRPPKKNRDSLSEINSILESFEKRLRHLETLAHGSRAQSHSRSLRRSITRSPSPTPHTGSDSADNGLGRPRYDIGTAARPVYHGELSMFDNPETRPSRAVSPQLLDTSDTAEWTEERLRAAARLRHRYASVEDGEKWMESYFCWASCADGIVHRPTFLRDMALDGPYFSEFLLIIIYIVGIRLTYGMDERERTAKGEQYLSLAMSMLAEQIMGPGRIVTVQALLVLSGRQIAVGTTNQAWMLLGMAIRMMEDMGLHLPISEDAACSRFSDRDRDMRNRLFWSAYIWDKTMSLALGRESSFGCRPGLSTDSLPQDSDDNFLWEPHMPPGTVLPRAYPPVQLLKTFTLRHYAQLNIILENVMNNMYSPQRPNTRSLSFIRTTIEQLDGWRNNLPSVLKLESPGLPEYCPPPNSVLVNLLYYTIRIFLYRPLLTETAKNRSSLSLSAVTQCKDAAVQVNEILALWSRTFGNHCHHYLILYYCFISAGVDVYLIRTGNSQTREEALQRVQFSLQVLEQASLQGPCIRRGIVNIRSQLDHIDNLPGHRSTDMGGIGRDVSNSQRPSSGGPTPGAISNSSTMPGDDFAWFGDGHFWDHQTLLDMLRAAPISTENPFATWTTNQSEIMFQNNGQM